MGLISSQFPFTDPGSLMGGIREQRVHLEGLQSDAFRSAAQSQNTGQAARAFSGADVTNVNAQDANLTQVASSSAEKSVTIDPVTATNPAVAGFDFNYLQRYIAGAEASDLLARGALNIAQDQGGDQSAFARLMDFDGNVSTASNDLEQMAQANQIVDADLNATVVNTTLADAEDLAFNQSRFRDISVCEEDKSAQAIFTSGQRQGHAAAPVAQVAVSDGAESDNTLNQMAVINQNGTVNASALFDLRRNEVGILSPRTTELLAWMKNNSAINSSASSQEQALVQSAAGGVNEDGQQTENDGSAENSAHSTAVNTEHTTVGNTQTILI
jgi:hypothetical protein